MATHRSGGVPDDYTVKEFMATEFGVDEDDLFDALVGFLAMNPDLRAAMAERFRVDEQAKAAEWHTMRRQTPEDLEYLEEGFRREFEDNERASDDEPDSREE